MKRTKFREGQVPYQEKLVVQQRVGNELKMQIYLKIIKENVLFSVGLDSPSTFSFRSQKSIGFSMLQENKEENRPKTLLKEKNIENTLE
jgi:hypothetical protein